MHQGSEARIVRTAQGNEGHFVITGVIHQLASQFFQNFRLAFTHRAIHHTCVTETAATATATENFQHNSIVNNIVERYDGSVGEINGVHIFYNAFFDNSRHIITKGFNCFYSIVFIINSLVEAGHVDAFNFYNFIQEAFATANFASFLPSFVRVHQLNHNFFTLADDGKVKEISQRFRIVNAGTAYDNEGIFLATFCCENRHTTQFQHIQNVGVGKLVLQGKANDVTFSQGLFSFQSTQGNVTFTHFGFHINPRSVNAFSLYACFLIQKVVQNLKAQIAHAHFVHVGESKGNGYFSFFRRLNNAAELAASITGRLLHAA